MIGPRKARRIARDWEPYCPALRQFAETGTLTHIEDQVRHTAYSILNYLICHPYPISRPVRPPYAMRDAIEIRELIAFVDMFKEETR